MQQTGLSRWKPGASFFQVSQSRAVGFKIVALPPVAQLFGFKRPFLAELERTVVSGLGGGMK